MGDFFGSVRKSLVFRPYSNPEENSLVSSSIGNLTEKIGSSLRKSKASLGIGFSSFKIQSPPTITEEEKEEETHPIRWRKGELIGCGAFGHVYMGMNLDSGELLAVKQVMIGVSSASKEKAQAHIRELEEEVKLLKNLSHANIVRYLGTAREDDTLNILLEFVPGGSISSLLGKFGSFPEAVIRMYTKQLLQGLEYLHHNNIIHRDIKGANILVDNKGCIKLADFGASKQVAKLATTNQAKSMKGTPYWMAPEVIVQSGYSFSADIWSVGCTVIEMATGKPPWSQQYQEVAALFHVGTTKSHPPIPEHLSSDAKDFLLKCLQQEPNLRPTASKLLQHPFVAREYQDSRILRNSSSVVPSRSILPISKTLKTSNLSPVHGVPRYEEYGNGTFSILSLEKDLPLRPLWETGNSSDSMCLFDNVKSFNPMSEPFDDWSSKFDLNPERKMAFDGCVSESICNVTVNTSISDAVCEQDDEVIESKIRAFLDEKALELKKLQTPLFEEFELKNNGKETAANTPKLPPKSPSKAASHMDFVKKSISPLLSSRRYSCVDANNNRILKEIQSPRHNELGEPSETFSKKEDEWRKELADELESLRQQGTGAVRASPNLGRSTSRKRDRFRFTSPEK